MSLKSAGQPVRNPILRQAWANDSSRDGTKRITRKAARHLGQSAETACDVMEKRILMTSLAVWNFNDASTSGSGASNAALVLSVDRPAAGITATMTTNFPTTGAAGLVSFGGSTVNADSSDTAGAALGVASNANNGDYITFAVAAGSYSSLMVSFATQRTSTGYTGNQFQYSLDGTTFTNFGAAFVPAAAFATQSFDLTSITGLNNDPSAAFRIVFNGATSSSGNNRIDNLVVAGTLSPPAVTSLSPSTGTAGTSVTINGTGFTGASAVLFGSTTISSSNFTVNSAGTQITLTAPSGSGTEEIQVTTPAGSSATGTSVTGDKFTYQASSSSPTVSNVSPNNAPYTVSTSITITGSNLLTTTSVNFGTVAVTPTRIDSSGNYLTVQSPVLTGPGSVEISVTTSNGTSTLNGASVDGFTYTAPTIGSVGSTGADNNTGTQRMLTASNVAAETNYSISSVSFYLETGVTAGYSSDDTLLPGTVTNTSGNYSLNFTPSSLSLAAGTYTFYAVARSTSGGTAVGSSTFTVITPIVAFTSTAPFFNQSAGTVSISVSRSIDDGDPLTINYNTSGGTAVPGTDYTAVTAGSLMFPSGSSTQTLTLPITLLNPSGQIGTKTFDISLYNPTVGGTVIGAQAVVSINQTPRAFTRGDIVIDQTGDGANALAASGNTVYLDEYTTSGTLVQSFALPLVQTGNTTTEGFLSLTADGTSLVVPGYVSTSGSSTAVISASINGEVALVGSSASVDASTTIPFADFTGNNIRSAASYNGSGIWIGTSGNGVRYTTDGSTAKSTQVSTTVTNVRNVEIINGQLYVTDNSGTAVRLGTVGTGLPTNASNTITNIPGYPATTGSPYSYAFVHLNGTGTTPDTLYVADDGVGITKYSLVGGSWTGEGIIGSSSSAVRGLTASVNAGVVTIFATTGSSSSTGGGTLYTVTDAAGYNAAPSNSSLTAIATAGTDTTFRGVAFAPAVTIPAWLTLVSGTETWDGTNLTLNGQATIKSNPASSTVQITVNAGQLNVSAGVNVQIGGLALTNGGTFTLPVNTAPAYMVFNTSNGLTINPGTKFDLGNNILDVTAASLTTILSDMDPGHSSGSWTGTGITSTFAAQDSTHLTTIAAITNTNAAGTTLYNTIEGLPANASDVLIRYTYVGDANFDGIIDGSDYSNIDNTYLTESQEKDSSNNPTPFAVPISGWFNGDFNGDGITNGSDYTLIDNAFNSQGTKLVTPQSKIATPTIKKIAAVPTAATQTAVPTETFFSDRKIETSLIGQVESLIDNAG